MWLVLYISFVLITLVFPTGNGKVPVRSKGLMRFRIHIFDYNYIVFFMLHSIKRHMISSVSLLVIPSLITWLKWVTARFCQYKGTYVPSIILICMVNGGNFIT